VSNRDPSEVCCASDSTEPACEHTTNGSFVTIASFPLKLSNKRCEHPRSFYNDSVSLKWETRVLSRKLRFAGRSYRRRIPRWKERGFHVTVHFIWLPNDGMVIQRVASRVAQGGHDIAIPDIRRRYTRGLGNHNTVYLPIVDEAWVLNGAVRVLASLSEAE
jgi:hypothetical protein